MSALQESQALWNRSFLAAMAALGERLEPYPDVPEPMDDLA
jgi:hypothetical protein